MKTAYYNFISWEEDMASGFEGAAARQGALAREPGRTSHAPGGKVIDLNAWRAANLELMPQEDEADELERTGGESWGPDEPELVLPMPRPRRSHRRDLFAAELASTMAVACAAAALILRVLLF